MRKMTIAAAITTATAVVAPMTAKADKGCQTHACKVRTCKTVTCKRRVAHKRAARRPMTPAVASWYGPGLYGNPLACGGTLTPGSWGVANKSLPCGARVRLCFKRCVTAPVIDRGPYVGGRDFDLTAPVHQALGSPSVNDTVRWAAR